MTNLNDRGDCHCGHAFGVHDVVVDPDRPCLRCNCRQYSVFGCGNCQHQRASHLQGNGTCVGGAGTPIACTCEEYVSGVALGEATTPGDLLCECGHKANVHYGPFIGQGCQECTCQTLVLQEHELKKGYNNDLIITHPDGTFTVHTFGGDSSLESWCRTEYGLRVKHRDKARWRIYPWTSIKYYDNVPYGSE